MLFSGRIDILPCGEEETLKLFLQFVEYSQSAKTLVTREDKDKDGITPTKVHFHFLLSIFDAKHDTLRNKLSKMGWKGALASLSNALDPPRRTMEKTYHYLLKQGNIVYSFGYEENELTDLLEESKEYNDTLDLNPSFQHHFTNFIMPEMAKLNLSFRGDMLMHCIQYVTKYNQNERGVEMALPTTTSAMLRFIHKYEMKQFPNDCVHSILDDYRGIAGFNETAKSLMDKEIYEIKERRKHARQRAVVERTRGTPILEFNDSEDEDLVI